MTTYRTAVPTAEECAAREQGERARSRCEELLARVRAWRGEPSMPADYQREYALLVSTYSPQDWLNAVETLLDAADAEAYRTKDRKVQP